MPAWITVSIDTPAYVKSFMRICIQKFFCVRLLAKQEMNPVWQ